MLWPSLLILQNDIIVMTIRGKQFKILQIICLCLYYGIARWFPKSGPFFNIGGRFRRVLCRQIFKKCGKCINVERGAIFGSGTEIEIGDYSGIGINANIPSNTIIGNYVMMGPNCIIFPHNHEFKDVETPMMFQGNTTKALTVIGDDVWIGQNVMMTPGRHIAKGSIIAAGCVLSKNFPDYSVIGGNPSVLLKERKNDEKKNCGNI